MTDETAILGFRRLGSYKRAATPEDVAHWAGVPLRVGELVPSGAPTAPQRAVAAWADIDSLANDGRWTPLRALELIVDRYVAEIIGCDQPSAPQRLRAAVVRAYAEADFLANFFAEYTRDLRTSARPIALQVRAIVKELQDLLPRGVEILTQWRWESSEEKAGRSEGLKESLSELRTLEQELEGIADSVPQFGRLPEVPRLFFTIRLAEAFALLSGEKPEYHASGWGSADGRVPSRWERFLTAAIEAVALPTGIQGVDGILRKVARNYVVHRRAIGILAEKSATLLEGNWFQEPDDRWRFQPISYGDLQSTGLLIDYHVPLPWERQ